MVKKQEQKIWDDMRGNWEYIDKIYATYDEYLKFSRMSLTEEQKEQPLEALFDNEKRMFLEDIAFIITRNDLYRIIFLNYLSDDLSTLIMFDHDGDMIAKMIFKVKGKDVIGRFDKKNPIGTKYYERYTKEYLEKQKLSLKNMKEMAKAAELAATEKIATEVENSFNFILTAIHHVLQNTEIRKVSDRPIASGSGSSTRSTSKSPTRLTKIIYEGRRTKRSKTQFHRHTESWKVRGHWRVYSDGKRTWVKPHVKGRKSTKYQPLGTDYRL